MMGVTLAHVIASIRRHLGADPGSPHLGGGGGDGRPHPADARLRRGHTQGHRAGMGDRPHALPVPVIELAGSVLRPLTWVASAVVAGILAPVRAPARQHAAVRLSRGAEAPAPDGAGGGGRHHPEAEMIDNIFDLGERTVREIMVPLVDVAALPQTATPEQAVRLIWERGFSRIPVYSDRVLNLVGVVTAMDLLRRGVHRARSEGPHAARPCTCRRRSASTTCSARCRRAACSSRWWWTSTAARSAS